MGRPFIAYDSNDQPILPSCDQPSTSARSEWMAKAKDTLVKSGWTQGRDDSREVDHVLSFIHKRHRVAYLPRVRPGTSPITATRIGGMPFLKPGEQWPTGMSGGTRTPLTFFLQLRLEDLPQEVHRAMADACDDWRSTGLFQLFVDEALPGYDINNHRSYYLVRVVPVEELTNHELGVRLPDGVRRFEERVIASFDEVVDWPSYDDLDLSEVCHEHGVSLEAVEGIVDTLMDASLVQPNGGDKLMGWPDWTQGPEWALAEDGSHYVQFLQVVGNILDGFSVGDCGTMVVQRHPSEDTWRLGWDCS